jgi:chemotaxis protein MotB
MSKKKHDDHEEHVNHEAWVIPYADLMTLLMAMFIVLWALGNGDKAKAEAIKAGFAAELGIGPAGASLGGTETGGTTADSAEDEQAELQAKVGDALEIQRQADTREAAIRSERQELEQTAEEIRKQLEAKGLTDEVKLQMSPEGLVVVASEGLLFGPGSADLGEEGRRAIDLIAEPMKGMTQPIRIEGHTDSTPISNGRFPSNWELSSGRASTVLRHLIADFGVAANRLSAAGYADTQPVGDNATPEGRAANRRVEIVLVATRASAPLPANSEGVPGATDLGGVPAPIGPDGPLGAPLDLAPDLPKQPSPSTTAAPTAVPTTTAAHATEPAAEGGGPH